MCDCFYASAASGCFCLVMWLHVFLCVATSWSQTAAPGSAPPSTTTTASSPARVTVNFDYAWRYTRGGVNPPTPLPVPPEALPGYDDSRWDVVDAPHDMGRTHELSCMRTGIAQPPPPPPPPPQCRIGNLAGGDIHNASMTTAEATSWCKTEPKCGGWSAEQPYPKSCTGASSSAPGAVHFKDSWGTTPYECQHNIDSIQYSYMCVSTAYLFYLYSIIRRLIISGTLSPWAVSGACNCTPATLCVRFFSKR